MFLFCLHNIVLNLVTTTTTFFLFSLYSILIPLILGFWQELLYTFHLGILWTCLLFSFLPDNLYTLDYSDGTLELFCLSRFAPYSLILFSKLVGYWILKLFGILFSYLLLSFFYQYDPSFITLCTLTLGSFIFILISGLHSSFTVNLEKAEGTEGATRYLISLPALLPLILLCNYIQIETTHFLFLIGLGSLYLCAFLTFGPYILKSILNR